jgi:hypothetical protein
MEAGTFDLAGTCLGIVERDDLLDGTAGAGRRRDPRAAVVRAARQRLLAGPSLVAERDIPLVRPYQEQLTMTLGDVGRDAVIATEPGSRWRRSARSS